MKRSIFAAVASGLTLGGIVAGAVLIAPLADSVSRSSASSTARISQQPPLSPSGLPGPIIWDREQLKLAPADVQALWITPYTIRDNATGRVLFSAAQRGGE